MCCRSEFTVMIHIIIIIILGLNARRSPINVLSLSHWMSFPAIGIGSGVLGFRPYWGPSPFPSLSMLGVFHSLLGLTAIGFQSCFFLTADVAPPIRSTVDPSPSHFLGELPGLGLALIPDVVVSEAD